ncbi:MAG: TMEM175 family protein [Actinomycetes bacterium]
MTDNAPMTNEAVDDDPWTQNFYPREGPSTGFDRVVFFTDAVFAISLTLVAVEIGVPELSDPDSKSELWHAIVEKSPGILAFIVAFAWVAFYWRANHRFTTTLRGMSSRYIATFLVYLAFVALLPFPAGLLGEGILTNPVGISFFAVFAACMSTMEAVLFVVADRQNLFIRPISPQFRRLQILGSLSPVPGFLISIPVAFIYPPAAYVCWIVITIALGWVLSRWLPATAP